MGLDQYITVDMSVGKIKKVDEAINSVLNAIDCEIHKLDNNAGYCKPKKYDLSYFYVIDFFRKENRLQGAFESVYEDELDDNRFVNGVELDEDRLKDVIKYGQK